MKKLSFLLLVLFGILAWTTIDVSASYIYTPKGEVASPEALTVTKIVDSSNLVDINGDLTNLALGELVDVAAKNGFVYLVDESNNRVVVLNNNYEFVNYFPKEEDQEKLSSPKGIFVTNDYIYVCDYGNYRVAIFDTSFTFIRAVGTPDDPTFKEPNDPDETKYPFKPLKIAVDRTGRMYVFAENVFEGFVELSPEGEFSRYFGANKITISAWDAFWLMFTSEAQKKAQGLRISETLVNVNVDEEGYVYSVSKSTEGAGAIKKLNSKGTDVLSRNGYYPPIGDIFVYEGDMDIPSGSSELIDIDINDEDGYIVLDKTRGRIFTYDFEGNLLYIGGELGNVGTSSTNQSDAFLSPEALCYNGDDILAVDSMNHNLLVFGYTEFAQKVNLATKYYKDGKYEEAASVWEEILKLNSNYCLAYAGVGKAQLRRGEYNEAMTNLKLGYDYYNYSKAYQQYRYDKMTKYIPYVLTVVIAGALWLVVNSVRKAVKEDKKEEKNE